MKTPKPIQADALQPEIKAALEAPVAGTYPPKEAAPALLTSAAVPRIKGAADGLPEVVRFDKVTKSFGEGEDLKVAIEDVSFVVEDLPGKGELVCLVGPSGCGKSTVLRLIAGLSPQFPPTSGVVEVFGKPITGPGADRGVVDQKYSLLPHLTVLENIAFGLQLRGVKRGERLAQAREWIGKVGLEGAEDEVPERALGRHAAARRHRLHAHLEAAHPAHG